METEGRTGAPPGQVRPRRVLGRRGERQAQRLQADFGRVEGHVHMAGRDGSRLDRIDDGAFRAAQFDRGEDPVVEGQVGGHQPGHLGHHLALNDVRLGVEVVGGLGRGTGEVEDQAVAVHGQLARDLEELVLPLGPTRGPVRPVREQADAAAHLGLRQVADRLDAVDEHVDPHGLDHAHQFFLGHVAPGHQAAHVHLDQRRDPHVVAEDVPDLGHLDPLAEQADGREPESLLEALGSHGANDPATMPPTSIMCADITTQAINWPWRNTGRWIMTSWGCSPPP